MPVYLRMVYQILAHRTADDVAEEVARLSTGEDAVEALTALSRCGRYTDLELRHEDAPEVVLYAWHKDAHAA